MQAIGTVDELNSSLGVIPDGHNGDEALNILLQSVQNDLFDVGGDLCFPEDAKPDYALKITQHYVDKLERWIDHYNADLPDLTSFILPGGSQTSAYLHISRSLARRAERDICALGQEEDINRFVLQYLNRLSDLLFVLARYHNQQGQMDRLWCPGGVNKPEMAKQLANK